MPFVLPLLGTWPATQACALDWESNWQPFDSQASAQSTESNQPGLFLFLKLFLFILFTDLRGGGGRERGRETSICCSTYLLIYWLILVCALIGD